jgi:hypothetical protein
MMSMMSSRLPFHKKCTRWQNCGEDDAISVKVIPVPVEDLRK